MTAPAEVAPDPEITAVGVVVPAARSGLPFPHPDASSSRAAAAAPAKGTKDLRESRFDDIFDCCINYQFVCPPVVA